MKNILITLALATTSMFANEPTPAKIVEDTPYPQRYMYGVTRIPGTVKLKLRIDEQGKLRHVDALKGRPDLVASAIRMVHDYKYAAAASNGQRVASDMEVELNFRFSQD
jgi:hypothetical protein